MSGDLGDQLKPRQERIEAALKSALQTATEGGPRPVADAMAYSLFTPGKRLRPLLVVLACEAALMGAEVDAIDISPAMLALANIQARDRKVAIRTQPAGMLSFAYQPNSYDLIVSEFTLHHLPDFWKAVALARIHAALKPGANFYLRDIVFVSMPDGADRSIEQWADFSIKNHDFERDSVVTHMRDEYSTFGWVIERMLTDIGFTLESVDYHAPLHGTYILRKPKPDQPS